MKTLAHCRCRIASLLLPGLLLVGSTACDKAEDMTKEKMPDATQEGKGTFGCLVDGKLWVPYNPNSGSLLPADYTLKTYTFPVGASGLTVDIQNHGANGDNAGIGRMSLSLRSASAIAPGVYTLSQGFSASANNNNSTTSSGGLELYDTVNGSGSVTITKVEPRTKTVNGITTRSTIVAGTFQFTARSPSGKTITVTDGRFDLAPSQ